MASFYSALKRVSPKPRFMFKTGICKYRELSAFTSGNYPNEEVAESMASLCRNLID